MEVLILFFVLGAGGYYFFRTNTKRGAENIRAYCFLARKQAGASLLEANQSVSVDVTDMPTDVIRAAVAHIHAEYGGKQLAMIREAYKQGMDPLLPDWYRTLSNINTQSSPFPQIQKAPDWVRPFVLYFIAYEMNLSATGIMPDSVRSLLHGQFTDQLKFDISSSLGTYLLFTERPDRASDYLHFVVQDAYEFVRAELRSLNSEIALKRFIRKMHILDTGTEISEGELQAESARIAAEIRADDVTGDRIRGIMLKDSVCELFSIQHGKTINAYNEDVVSYGQEALA